MAGIDVNDVLVDPLLSTTFDVIRRQETVDAMGRAVITETLYEGQQGIITWERGTIQRMPDGTLAQQVLNVVTPFSLRDASVGWQADQIIWGGETYLVTMLKPNRHFGRGFTRAVAMTTRATDDPPVMGNMP
jgi:hypothetical protein